MLKGMGLYADFATVNDAFAVEVRGRLFVVGDLRRCV
jgi:hypothetical protein